MNNSFFVGRGPYNELWNLEICSNIPQLSSRVRLKRKIWLIEEHLNQSWVIILLRITSLKQRRRWPMIIFFWFLAISFEKYNQNENVVMFWIYYVFEMCSIRFWKSQTKTLVPPPQTKLIKPAFETLASDIRNGQWKNEAYAFRGNLMIVVFTNQRIML